MHLAPFRSGLGGQVSLRKAHLEVAAGKQGSAVLRGGLLLEGTEEGEFGSWRQKQ